MQNWTISIIKLELKFDWKISRNTSRFKENFIIKVEDTEFGNFGHGEVAFNIRYNESKEKVLDGFTFFCDLFGKKNPFNHNGLKWLDETSELCHSLKMGINQAFVNLKIKQSKNSNIACYLGVSVPQSLQTSFSIPIIDKNEVSKFLIDNNLSKKPFLKLKINGSESISLLNQLLKHYNGKIRIDANEGFHSANEVLFFLDSIKDLSRIEFIEQPLSSLKNIEMKKIKGKCDVPFIADESITSNENIASLAEFFDGVNIKLMKSGTLNNATSQLKTAKDNNLKTMLGCMIETSLGISFAYALGENVDYIDLDGFLLLKNDPFNLLTELDGRISLI